MTLSDDDFKKKYLLAHDDEEHEEGGSGESGGTGTQIKFHDFTRAENFRDDLLPPEEMRRLLLVHKDLHTGNVKKQKELQAYREEVRAGKISIEQYRQGLQGGEGKVKYKTNPRFLRSQQFSGTSNNMTPLPSDNNAETNQDKKELVYRNELKLQNQPVPQFNPRPNRPGF